MSTSFTQRLLVSAAFAGIAAAGCRDTSSDVLVSAASSLRVALEEIAQTYVHNGGDHVVLNSGASSSLARQIVEGAPVDLFISADEVQMATAERAGKVIRGTRVDLLSNQLAIIAPSDSQLVVKDVTDLTAPDIRRIGMGNPAAVPVGVYTRDLLTKRALWERVQPKVIPFEAAEVALAAAEAGHVDVAFVYITDAQRSSRVRTLLVIPREQAPPIVYPAAIVPAGGHEQGARRFLDYLRGTEAKAVFTRHGFIVL